jgi:hypothetical protein
MAEGPIPPGHTRGKFENEDEGWQDLQLTTWGGAFTLADSQALS